MIDSDQSEEEEVYNFYVSSNIAGYQTKEHQMRTTCTVSQVGSAGQLAGEPTPKGS
jgi:hypothetical protein